MALRATSPAVSETEFDISNDLAAGNNGSQQVDQSSADLDIGNSDDDIYIASQLAASNRKASSLKGKTVKKGGGFQAMGLNLTLLKAVSRKGFSVPTPIQRKTIPLVLEGQDVVGMARTGSGKTAAFVGPCQSTSFFP